MPEIERRYLIRDLDAAMACVGNPMAISQSYVPGTGDWAIRLRKLGVGPSVRTLLTMKRPLSFMSADEHESDVAREFHDGLLAICGAAVEKTRRTADASGGLTWELDVFAARELAVRRSSGRIEPLVLVEIEIPSEDHELETPVWVGTEVTADKSFSNFQLARRIETVRRLVSEGAAFDDAIKQNLLEEPEA